MTSAAGCALGPACPVLTDRAVDDLARAGTIVLDSWHLHDGTGVAVDRHRARFTAAVAEVFGVAEQESGAAYDHALGHLPISGSWFPAFVWTADGLRCAVRMFPVERLRCTTSLGRPLPDTRKRADVKGIDYIWQVSGRTKALSEGYDDRPLVTDAALVTETIFATLLVIRGRELIVPVATRLPGVTLSVVREAAGIRLLERPVTMAELPSADGLLTLSALHGVRVVERLGDRTLLTDRRLRNVLQQHLESARRPVTDGSRPCGSC